MWMMESVCVDETAAAFRTNIDTCAGGGDAVEAGISPKPKTHTHAHPHHDPQLEDPTKTQPVPAIR